MPTPKKREGGFLTVHLAAAGRARVLCGDLRKCGWQARAAAAIPPPSRRAAMESAPHSSGQLSKETETGSLLLRCRLAGGAETAPGGGSAGNLGTAHALAKGCASMRVACPWKHS